MSSKKKNPLPSKGSNTPKAHADDGKDATQTQISQQLRSLYQSVQDEGIPERFLDLLQKLDEAEKNQIGGR
ncbi:NepR family anti-sigma factor [Breoghania sp.]|uniref:NepR family anti-sigma factor n=1 Tax=Breoghania sp. TaxID=2065378 RepID=UPI002602B337|nr:NepR family anti-sigma factor [Breoghania sp.]MDJ0931046.1 NepR family anti-sigma factor [Breoghania sp.]